MDARTLQILGMGGGGGSSALDYGPIGDTGAARYSSGGLSRTLATPYSQSGGVVRPTPDAGFNEGSMDPLLAAQMKMGDRGGYARGASAFLGSGYNPWTMETGGPEGEQRTPQNQNVDSLFDMAAQLGMDTSKYSRDIGTPGIRGERSGAMDAAQLYDDLNQYAKDYVSVDHMTDDGKSMERTIYRDQDGQLVPVTQPTRRSAYQDSAFFDDDFKQMLMTIGPALVGGFMAAPAAGAGAAGTAGGAAGTAGSAGGAAAGSASGSIPWGEIGTRALRGALTGGLTSGLQGGNILQGALMGGLSGGASGAGIPSGVLGIGKNVLSGALGMGGGGSGGTAGYAPNAAGGGVGGVGSSAPISGASALIGALGGGSSTGSAAPQLFNPDDARQRYLLNSLRLNRSGRAGDQSQDRANALQKALAELG